MPEPDSDPAADSFADYASESIQDPMSLANPYSPEAQERAWLEQVRALGSRRDSTAEDQRTGPQALPARERASAAEQTVCLRKTPRQATSAVAHAGAEPEEDDPLLSFAPYLHHAPRGNSITPGRQVRFIATLAATGIVSQAARSIGKSMEALYKLRARPGAEGFAHAWDEALERGMQRLEDCALERAVKGTPTPIVSGGQLLGTWDKPDNNLLRFMLQHRRSDRYGVQKIQPGHPIYEGIRKEIMAELGKNRLQQECDTIAAINAKIDAVRARSRVLELHREMGEMEQALDELGFLESEVLAIPCSTLLCDEEEVLWRQWDHPSWRASAMRMEL